MLQGPVCVGGGGGGAGKRGGQQRELCNDVNQDSHNMLSNGDINTLHTLKLHIYIHICA